MRTANLLELTMLSLAVLTVDVMAACASNPPRDVPVQPRHAPSSPACNSQRHSNHDFRGGPAWGVSFSTGIPANNSRTYVPPPPCSSSLVVGGTVYNIDGGGDTVVDCGDTAPEPEPQMDLLETLIENLGRDDAKQAALYRLGQDLEGDPEARAKIERWMAAREHARQVREAQEADRERRRLAHENAEKLRDQARRLRTIARDNPDQNVRKSLENAAESMDQGANNLDRESSLTKEQRESARTERRGADRAESEAAGEVDPGVRNLIEEAEKESQNRPRQERVDLPE